MIKDSSNRKLNSFLFDVLVAAIVPSSSDIIGLLLVGLSLFIQKRHLRNKVPFFVSTI